MNILAKLKTKKRLSAIFLVCTVSLIVSFVVVIFSLYPYFAPDATLHMAGRHEARYRVVYLDNDVFGSGEIPIHKHFLMSFTDHWEFESYFSSAFTQMLDIDYNYSATAVLLIRHLRANNSNINPVVHEVAHLLTDGGGSVTGDSISLRSGIFTIEPKGFIDAYFEFITQQQAQMHKENIIPDRQAHFSAELAVYFIYQLQSGGGEVSETFRRGYTIPLTSEVYNFSGTGTGTFEQSIRLREFNTPSLFAMIIIVLWFSGLVGGVCVSLRGLTKDSDQYRRELKRILRRYADEIAVAQETTDLSEYKTVTFATFAELLKLAVNMGRQIICCHGDRKSDFWVVADGCAYCFCLEHSV